MNVSFKFKEGKETNLFIWYVTLNENEITLFSNESYLNYNEKEKKVIGDRYMKIWKYEEINDNNFILYFQNQENILTKDGDKVIVKSKKKINQIFELINL